MIVSPRKTVSLVLVLTLSLLALAGCNGGEDLAGKPKGFVLITIDTLRADHLNCYGYRKRVTSPRLDELAEQGALFERVQAPAPWTIASTATLLTGLEPFRHGFTFPDKAPLSAHATTAAEILKQQGFATGAFCANILVCPETSFDQGFDLFKVKEFADAREITDSALIWLDENADGPFFLYLHYFDPHDPYDDPDGIYRQFDPDYTGSFNGDIAVAENNVKAGRPSGLSPRDLEHVVARYDAEIRFADQEIGRLLDALKDEGLFDSSVLSVVSDHGEQFLEHEGLKHGTSVHQEELWVPWILRAPQGIEPGTRVSRPVRLADVLPTCLELLEMPGLEGVDGQALDVMALAAEDGGDRAVETSDRIVVFSETQHGVLKVGDEMKEALEILTALSRDWKLIRLPDGEERLYPVETGFDEAVQTGRNPVIAKWLSEELDRWKNETTSGRIEQTPYSDDERDRIRDAIKQKLIKIGYLAPEAPQKREKGPEKDED